MKTELKYKKISSPLGEMTLIASEKGLVYLLWYEESMRGNLLSEKVSLRPRDPFLLRVERQLKEYFAGERTDFDIPVDPKGTPFQKKVWKLLSRIPYGKTTSYGELAEKLGDAKKARAVGGANNKNPLPIIVPCHRVIGRDGTLTGFAVGLKVKEQLLEMEGSFNRV